MPAEPHDCPGCGAPGVPRHQLGCRQCWFRLPQDIRGRVDRAYAAMKRHPYDGDYRAAHRRAIADALEWYRANPAVNHG